MDFNHDIEKARQALTRSGADGLLVETQANFHWLTGGRGFIGLNSETACAALLITRDRQYLVANNIEAKRLMAEELCGTFDLLEYPWHDESGKRKAIKTACSGAIVHDCEIVADLQNARTILPEWRIDRLRRSGQIIARILEQELLAAKKGMTELELAGRLSSLLWREKVEPVTILIGFDERTESYRHLLPTENRLHHRAVASLAVRHRGLFISVTRHICFGTVPAVIAAKHQAVSLVHAAAINATRAGATMDDMFHAIAAAYRQQGHPDEWHHHHQGGLTGFVSRERRAMPGDTFTIAPQQSFAWNPTIAGVKSEETVVLHADGSKEILTGGGDWPVQDYDGVALADIAAV